MAKRRTRATAAEVSYYQRGGEASMSRAAVARVRAKLGSTADDRKYRAEKRKGGGVDRSRNTPRARAVITRSRVGNRAAAGTGGNTTG